MAQVLDKFAAGELLRKKREQLGLTQEQVVEATTVPVAAYLSELENGKVNLARSKHFSSLAAHLRFTEEEIRSINPSAVITVTAPEPAFDPKSLFHPPTQRRREKRSLWPNLAAMIEEKQEKHPPLREMRWQQHMNQTRFSGGREPDPEGWFEMYQTMRRNNVEPEDWPDDE